MLDLGGAERIAVISDLHANATALRAVIADLDEQRCDRLVILGDLLTYGVEVEETLALVDELTVTYPTHFVRGNHDQIYIDLDAGEDAYLEGRPEFVQVAARWTHALLDVPFELRFPWVFSITHGEVYFSHANPFTPGDWRYLQGNDAVLEGAAALRQKGALVGVFGHTHRAAHLSIDDDKIVKAQALPKPGEVHVVNAGSVGQPRGEDKRASYLVLDREQGLKLRLVDYDRQKHLKTLRASDLDATTKAKLAGFFK